METADKAIAITEARRNFIDPPFKVNFVDVFELWEKVLSMRIILPYHSSENGTKQAFTSSETLPLTIITDQEGAFRGIVEG